MSGDQLAEVYVVGAGGIGCAVGYALRRGGVCVTFVDADAQKIAWGREHGVGLDDEASVDADFVDFDGWESPEGSIVFLCTKCFDNEAVLGALHATTRIIPVQNGFDRALMERCAIEGIASFVSECHPERTQTRITRPGDLHIGRCSAEHDGPIDPEINKLISVLEEHGSFRVRRVDNVLPYKYSKLMYNAAISPLAAVSGMDNGQLLTNGSARRLFFRLLRENYGILRDADIALARIGPFHPRTVDKILRSRVIAWAMARPFSKTLRHTYCSMSGDIEKGRTEIDNFNGHLLELANGKPCELNRSAYALVKRMEQARETPGLRWLSELAA